MRLHFQPDFHPGQANLCKRLRYLLGGNRPSQTTHQILSFYQIHGSKLEFKTYKGGISLAPLEINQGAPTYSEHAYPKPNIKL